MGDAAVEYFLQQEGRRLGLKNFDEAEDFLYGSSRGDVKRKPFECEFCKKRFHKESSMMLHRKDVHAKRLARNNLGE